MSVVERLKLRSYASEQECRVDDAEVMTDASALIQSLSSQLAEAQAEVGKAIKRGFERAADISADRDRLAAENERLHEREESAREFVKRHPALSLIDLAEFEAFLKIPDAFRTALASLEDRA